MAIIMSIDAVGAILAVVLFAIAALGITIASVVLELLYMILAIASAGLSVLILLIGIFCFFSAEKKQKLRYVFNIIFQGVLTYTAFFSCSLTKIIDSHTSAVVEEVISRWFILCAIILLLNMLNLYCMTTARSDSINRRQKVGIVLIDCAAVVCSFIFIFVRLWFAGAEYNHYLNTSSYNYQACNKQFIVTAEEAYFYKTDDDSTDKNELIAKYPKGTVFSVKMPFLSHFIEGQWSSYTKVRSDELRGFYGKLVSPDGKIGYIAYWKDDGDEDPIESYDKPTKAETYAEYNPLKVKYGFPLYQKYDPFHYKNYIKREDKKIKKE